LDLLIRRCLKKRPEDRPDTIGVVRAGLADVRATLADKRTHRPRFRRLAVPIPVGMLILALVWVGVWSLAGRHNTLGPLTGSPVRLTNDSGSSKDPSISADGKLVAYVSDRGGSNYDLYVQQVGGSQPIRLTNTEFDEGQPHFSPDATQIVFRSTQDGGGIFVVPTFGGEPKRIAGKGFRPRFSPDGKQVVFWTSSEGVYNNDSRIYVMSSSGGPVRTVRGDFDGAAHPIWTPDGEHLLFFGRQYGSAHTDCGYWITPLSGGQSTPVHMRAEFPPDVQNIRPEWWWKDRLFCSVSTADTVSIWELVLSVSTGKPLSPPRRLASGAGNESQVSVSDNGKLVFTSTLSNEDIYAVPIDANRGQVTGELQRLTNELSREYLPTLSADGRKMAFKSDRSGHEQVWLRDIPSGKEVALADINAALTSMAIISPDGARVAYSTFDQGKRNLLVIGTDNRISELWHDHGQVIGWTPDSKRLLFTNYNSSFNSTFNGHTVSLFDPRTKQLVDILRFAAPHSFGDIKVSPDGVWLAASIDRGPSQGQIMVMPFRSDLIPSDQWIAVTDERLYRHDVAWSLDGNLLYWFANEDGRDCLYAQRLNVSTKRPVGAHFAVRHFHYAVSRQQTAHSTNGNNKQYLDAEPLRG
jgi:eukaryotic-like serine/threonine-protein kinase